MLTDGRTVPAGEIVKTAVCVIGAGPAGLILSKELGASGIEVLLLDRGGRNPEAHRPEPLTAVSTGIEYDTQGTRAFELGGSVHKWSIPTPIGDGYGRLRELDAPDFQNRPWIDGSGWPISWEQLTPYYKSAREIFFPQPQVDHPGRIDRPEQTTSPDGIEVRDFELGNAAVFPGELTREIDRSPSVLALTNSVAVEIVCSDREPSRVSSVKVMTEHGHSFEVRATAYVLAAGGIENARLLLSSRGRHTSGVGNSDGLVGRYFMEHPHYHSGFLITDTGFEPFSDDAWCGIHVRDGIPVQKMYSLTESDIEREALNRIAFRIDRLSLLASVQTLNYSHSAMQSIKAALRLRRSLLSKEFQHARDDTVEVFRGLGHVMKYGAHASVVRMAHGAGMSRYTGRSVYLIRAMAEQVPSPVSRVTLSGRLDDFGVPLAEVCWRLTDQDLRSMYRSQEIFGRYLKATGIRETGSLLNDSTLPPSLSGGSHHMGTTRMSTSPNKGVVDANCKVHGQANLYIAGSSVFPTGGYANPTLTILALSLRLANHLKPKFMSNQKIYESSRSESPPSHTS